MTKLRFLALVLGIALLPGCLARNPVAPVGAGPAKVRTQAADASAAAALISKYRGARGLGPVVVDTRLNAAAAYQARAVAQAGSLSHGDFQGRMATFNIQGQAAENLSAGVGSVEEAITQWSNSSGHNANLLLPGATRIGLARADSGSGYGRYWALVLAN
jgi:uncharacterized protein YkwD